MEKIKNLLKRLCEIPSVCGREGMGKAMLFDLAGQYFDNMYSDSFGNLVLVKKSLYSSFSVMILTYAVLSRIASTSPA